MFKLNLKHRNPCPQVADIYPFTIALIVMALGYGLIYFFAFTSFEKN